MDIGYVLITENNHKIWIFATELNEQTRREYRIEDTKKYYNQKNNDLILKKYTVAYKIASNHSTLSEHN